MNSMPLYVQGPAMSGAEKMPAPPRQKDCTPMARANWSFGSGLGLSLLVRAL